MEVANMKTMQFVFVALFISCFSGASNLIEFSKTHSAYTYEHTGANLGNPPGGFGDKLSFHCVGMATSFAGKSTNTNVCEAFSTDGDKLLVYFSVGSDGKATREVLAGTGQYEGLVSSGIPNRLQRGERCSLAPRRGWATCGLPCGSPV
jgi:hypothetical protein